MVFNPLNLFLKGGEDMELFHQLLTQLVVSMDLGGVRLRLLLPQHDAHLFPLCHRKVDHFGKKLKVREKVHVLFLVAFFLDNLHDLAFLSARAGLQQLVHEPSESIFVHVSVVCAPYS